MFFSHIFFFQPLTNMYKPFKHDWVSALKQCRLLRLLCCRPSAPRRCTSTKSWECALQHTHTTPSTCQPFLPLTPHLPSAHLCAGVFWLFYFFAPCLFFILQSSIQLPEPPSLLPPLHCFTIVRRQKLISLRASHHVDPLHHSKSLGRSNSGTGNHSQVASNYWLWWNHFSLEFGNVGCSFPEEELGYLWFKYPVSVFCGANTDTNVLRGVGGKGKDDIPQYADGIYHGWIACVEEK